MVLFFRRPRTSGCRSTRDLAAAVLALVCALDCLLGTVAVPAREAFAAALVFCAQNTIWHFFLLAAYGLLRRFIERAL